MSWLFSQALAEEYLAATCSDGEPYAQSNGSRTPQAYCAPDKMTAFSRLSRFGMTFKPLTDAHGEELLTWYLAGFRAKTSAPQELARELQGGGRSGLWREMARIIGEVRPSLVFVENSPLLVGRGLAIVLGDLASMGYDAEWFCLSASDCGAPHQRDRIWIVGSNTDAIRRNRQWESAQRFQHFEWRETRGFPAPLCSNVADTISHDRGCQIISCETQRQDPIRSAGGFGGQSDGGGNNALADSNSEREQQRTEVRDEALDGSCDSSAAMANGNGNGIQGMVAESQPGRNRRQTGLHSGAREFPSWPADPADAPESRVGRVVNGMAGRVDRLKAIGNGQVPRVAAAAFSMLSGK